MEKGGFYVFNETVGGHPKHRHICQDDAIAEAKRLAALNPGKVFDVVAVTASCVKEDVTVDFSDLGREIYARESPF